MVYHGPLTHGSAGPADQTLVPVVRVLAHVCVPETIPLASGMGDGQVFFLDARGHHSQETGSAAYAQTITRRPLHRRTPETPGVIQS